MTEQPARRCRFLHVGVLCAAFVASARASDAQGQHSGVTSAALEALRGHPKQARALLGSGKGDPTDPAALVVLASMALDDGNTREAARLVARLRAVAPGAPEGRLLEALVKDRAARPQGDWVSAGLDAVVAVQPLARAEPLVALQDRVLDDFVNARSSFPDRAAESLSSQDRFLARWAWPQPAGKNEVLLREALLLATSDERQLVLLAVMDVLATAEPTGSEGIREADLLAAQRAARGKLRGTPARFVVVQPGTDAKTVGEDEVAALEALVAQGDPPSFASNYTELLRILERLDPAIGPWFAQAKAVHLTMPPTSLLTIVDRAARGSLSDGARGRLAAAFVRLADRERREGLLITDLFGAIYLGNAAVFGKDPALRARTEAIRPEVEALSDAGRCFAPLLALPIGSMQRAWAEQRPQERAFLQQAARRGLSCPEPKPQPKNVEEPPTAEPSAPCPDPAAAVTR